MITTPPGEPVVGPWLARSIDEVASWLLARVGPPARRPTLVAVDGRSASGKTTIAGRIADAVQGAVAVHTDDVAWWESFFDWDHLLTAGILDNAEHVPYPDASFDLAISEYGASIWADPNAWIPEAARLLRPGGRLIFLVNATDLMLCMPDAELPATAELVRPLRGLHRLEWSSDASVNFALSHGDWIRLLRASGFAVENLIELWPAEDASTTFPYVTLEWARQWPTEEVWIARREG